MVVSHWERSMGEMNSAVTPPICTVSRSPVLTTANREGAYASMKLRAPLVSVGAVRGGFDFESAAFPRKFNDKINLGLCFASPELDRGLQG